MRTTRKTRRFRERLTAVLAVVGAATLMTGFIVVGTAGTAQAGNEDNTNSATYWQGQGYGTCEDPGFSSESGAYVMPAAPTGMTWTLLVVKAGSTGHSVTDENELFDNPVAGLSYKHPEKDSISHVIQCWKPGTPSTQPQKVDLKLTYMVDCDLTKNTWRVRNETGETVQTTWEVYGGGAAGSHTATAGDTYFTTAYGSQTLKLKWGDGQTIAYGETVKASGPDAENCQPQPEIVTPVAPQFIDPTCEVPQADLLYAEDTKALDYTIVGDVAPGEQVVVTVVPKEGYAFPAETQTTWEHTYPTIKSLECEEPHKIKVDLDLAFVPDCVATHQWRVTNPSELAVTAWYGWGKSVLVPAKGTATFTTDAEKDYAWIFWGGKGTGIVPGFEKERAGADRTDCNYVPPPQPVLMPVTPEITYTDPCGTENDTVAGVAKTGYTFVVDQAAGTVTFTATPGYYLSGPTVLTAAWTDLPCPLEATPVAPTVVQSDECEVEGSYTIPDTPGVQYLLDGEPIAAGTYDGPAAGVVTAEAVGNTVLTIEDWSFDLVVTPATECEVAPVEVVDLCTDLDGVQAEVPEGYTLVEGVCVADQVAPTEAVAPVVGPVAPAAVPTAVDAGLAGPVDTGTGPGSPLGLGLVSAGLMMLLAAGALQTGRRERGTHEI